MTLTLQRLNADPVHQVASELDSLYEGSPWVVRDTLSARPFLSLAGFKYALANSVASASRGAQLALVQAHAALAGPSDWNADDAARIRKLQAAYLEKFGFPCVLALAGPRGTGLAPTEVIATHERRLRGHVGGELAECLRNLHRIAELRLNAAFDSPPILGNQVWDWHEDLARFSEPEAAAKGQLTVTYLTPAHRACKQSLSLTFRNCGFDEVHVDAVGNVVARYRAQTANAPALLTGSHFDTVRHGGKYAGRLGIFVPAMCVQQLARQGRRLPFAIELVAFADGEGQRYQTSFLGSSALAGRFSYGWLAQRDADRISMRDAMEHAGLMVDDIAGIARNPRHYLGFVEVHIEQGPLLNRLNAPLGVVTSISGGVRYLGAIEGVARHAGTTPMDQRRDAAAAAAELLLYVERHAAQTAHVVGTMGLLQVPGGSSSLVPGRCEFSLDLRAPSDGQRDALAHDVLAELAAICQRRNLEYSIKETARVNAAPSDPVWQQRWEEAVAAQGLPIQRLPSGTGHDAVKLHSLLPQAMLFVRGQNEGISHSPLESTTSDDMQLAVQTFARLLEQLAL